MRQSRRTCLKNIHYTPTTNPGLWLDKYLIEQLGKEETVSKDEETPQKKLVKDVAQFNTPRVYKHFYQRWVETLESAGASKETAKVQGRLAINLGEASVIETSISIHHTYGVPYIPGNALKGLAAYYARKYLSEEWGEELDAYRIMFGETEEAGYVSFFDALYVPDSGFDGKALWPDIITVHHQEYYQGQEKPPADWDDPNPVSFLSATGEYLIAISGPEEWVDKAFQILELALKEIGIGAKTSSGYGRMVFDEVRGPDVDPAESYAEAKLRLLQEETPPPGRERSEVYKVPRAGDYGFIKSPTGGKDVFVKPEYLRGKIDYLQVGQVVEYTRETTNKGPQAREVDVLLEPDDS
jgi:CRISPR-associated protein Cmr6